MSTEGSIRTSGDTVVLAGDFNAKSPVLCSPTTDIRGEHLADMAASLNLNAANTGSPTFVRGASETHIDFSFVSDAIVQRLVGWRVLMDVESASCHKYIAYSIWATAPRLDAAAPEGWNWRKTDCEKLNSFLTNTLMCETDVGELHKAIDEYIKRVCDVSMPKKKPRGVRKPVFWWSDEIAELRKSSLAARRTFQRACKMRGPEECREEQQTAREAMKALRLAVRRSQENAWKALCDSVDQDPWGLPYSLAEAPFTSITENEIMTIAHILPTSKAPGPDGIPDAIIKAVALARPREVAMVFNQCMEKGLFPGAWKSARHVLIRKPGKPLTLPSSYRPLSLINTVAKLFERVIKRRLEAHFDAVSEGLSCHQYGFRKGRSTLDASEAISGIVQRSGSGALAGRDLCALVAIDVAGAFNTALWRKIEETLCRKNVPGYLMNIDRSYLNDRQLLTDAGSMAVTCGGPQGSVIGPLLWYIFYDDLPSSIYL
ncbi:hypothetical protein QTP88_029136 [Uroleucon formosanum]